MNRFPHNALEFWPACRMSKVAEVGDCWGRLLYPLLYSGRAGILVEVDAGRPVASASAIAGNAEETA
jgi:hypothetical protein